MRRPTVKRDARVAMDRAKETWCVRVENRIHLAFRGTKTGVCSGLEIAIHHTEGQEWEFGNVLTRGRLRLKGDRMGGIHALIGGSLVVSDMGLFA